MVRPRWHDALIVAGIAALLATGVWALWWDEVRELLGAPPRGDRLEPSTGPAPIAPDRT